MNSSSVTRKWSGEDQQKLLQTLSSTTLSLRRSLAGKLPKKVPQNSHKKLAKLAKIDEELHQISQSIEDDLRNSWFAEVWNFKELQQLSLEMAGKSLSKSAPKPKVLQLELEDVCESF